jgi:hypothetical protein
MSIQSFENAYAKCWVEDGILFFVYKEGVTVDLNAAKSIIAERTHFQNKKSYPLITDIRGVSFFAKSARDYFANEGTYLIKCVAVIVGTPVSKLIANFYISASKPVIPTKIFTDKKAALQYVKPFID